MAKQYGAVALSGKLGDLVFQKGKHGKYVRTSPTLTDEQRKAKADLPQNRRTGKLNAVASAVNSAVDHYAGDLRKGSFYGKLLSAFRAEKSNERTLLLRCLWGLDINPVFAFENALRRPNVEVKLSPQSYTVEAGILMPTEEYKDQNSFSLEFILIVFTKGSDACRHDVQYTEWMHINDPGPQYVTVEFPRTKADTDYLLACRAVFAKNCEEHDHWSLSVMCILTGNAVTKKGLKMLADAEKAKSIVQPGLTEVKEKVRVTVRKEK